MCERGSLFLRGTVGKSGHIWLRGLLMRTSKVAHGRCLTPIKDSVDGMDFFFFLTIELRL